jgi:hypothetical protein
MSESDSDGERVPGGFTNPLINPNPDGSEVTMVPETQPGADCVEDSQPPSPARTLKAKRVTFTPEMDIALIRQLKKRDPFRHKPKSGQKGTEFTIITATLQGEFNKPTLTVKTVKGRVDTLFKKFVPLATTETGTFTRSTTHHVSFVFPSCSHAPL